MTYALITSGLKGSRREVYRQLCQFLIDGWRTLGVQLSFGEAGRGYIHNPNCFGTATAADLVMEDGYKLIGSAQAYRSGCVMQHGSIRLQPDPALFEKVFEERISQPDLPKAFDPNEIMADLTQAAGRIFDTELRSQPLTHTEIESATTTHPIALLRQSTQN